MTEVKRSYDASGRRAQARARRLAVVLAARDLFERDGYRPTTIAAIAAHAGVSAESVYKGFGTKAALAKAVFDLALAGDDEPVPVAERPAMQAVRDEPDVRRKIAMFAAGLAYRQARSARVTILIRDGRHVDDSLAPVWDKLRDEGLTGMTILGRHLLQTGQLREGIGLDEVRDVLWNYLAIDHYERLVLSQGWTLERYTRWLADAITSGLCPLSWDGPGNLRKGLRIWRWPEATSSGSCSMSRLPTTRPSGGSYLEKGLGGHQGHRHVRALLLGRRRP
jgi:AcrR family transcriptional regulator